MPIDASTLPVSGTALVAGLFYAAFSGFVSGPEIASREISRDSWRTTCEASLRQDIEVTRRADRQVPQVPDFGGMLCNTYPELAQLCTYIPDPNQIARESEARLRAIEDERIRNAAKGIGDRCACAEAVYIEEERISLALYAASARLISTSAIKNREAALTRALHSPVCSFGKGG